MNREFITVTQDDTFTRRGILNRFWAIKFSIAWLLLGAKDLNVNNYLV
jgi:hypothetical protein